MKNKRIKLEYSLSTANQMQIFEQDDSFAIVKLFLLHLGTNFNNTNISKECVEASLDSFYNKPIIYRLNDQIIPEQSTDVTEHAENNEQETQMQIGGIIPESASFGFEEHDGLVQLVTTGIVYKIYQQTLMDILQNRNGNIKVSIEILPLEAEQNENDGILYIKKFQFLSVCLLGFGVPEGIKNSHLTVTKFSADDYNRRYLTFSKNFIISNNIKSNVKNGLELVKKYNRGTNKDILNIANYLTANKYIGFDYINKLKQYFNNNHQAKKDKIPSNNYIGYMLCGGNDCYQLINSLGSDSGMEKESFIKKELVGSKDIIKVNTSKDAMSDSAWSNVDKSKLAKDALMCKNYKTAVPKVFLKQEAGWEDGKETALGYPVMQETSGEFVYNRAALGNARARAVQQNETGVLTQLKDIYKHLSLEWDNKLNNKDESKKDGDKMDTKDKEKMENAESDKDKTEKVDTNSEKVKDSDDELHKECDTLKKENEKLRTELNKYKKAEDEQKMSKYLDTYAHCMTDDEKNALKDDISKCSLDEFTKKVDDKIKAFAISLKDKDIKDKSKDEPKKFSQSIFGYEKPFELKKDSTSGGLDDVIANSNVKFKNN